MNHSTERKVRLADILPARDEDDEIEEQAREMILSQTARVRRQAQLLGFPDGEGGSFTDAELVAADDDIDPFDFERKERIADLVCVAAEMIEVRLLIVHSIGQPDSVVGGDADGQPGRRWIVHDRGLRAWMGIEILTILRRRLDEATETGRRSIAALLAHLKELTGSRTSAGILALILAVVDSKGVVAAAVRSRTSLPLRRVLAPGGQTSVFVPLA